MSRSLRICKRVPILTFCCAEISDITWVVSQQVGLIRIACGQLVWRAGNGRGKESLRAWHGETQALRAARVVLFTRRTKRHVVRLARVELSTEARFSSQRAGSWGWKVPRHPFRRRDRRMRDHLSPRAYIYAGEAREDCSVCADRKAPYSLPLVLCPRDVRRRFAHHFSSCPCPPVEELGGI